MFDGIVRRLVASRLPSLLAALPFLLLPALARAAAAQSLPPGFTEETIATGLRQPLTMYFAPDGRIFVNERVGNLRIIRNNQLLTDPFLRLNVNLSVIRGLMAFTFDPNFATNRFIYVYYNPPATETFRVSRFRAQAANPDLVESGSELVLYSRTYNTFDSTREIPFGPDGKMYMGGAEGNIRRIDPLNYPNVIPADNPTAGSDVWTTGLRNPSGITFDPATGRLFANNAGWHAGQGGEKIHEIFRGSQQLLYAYDHPEAGGAITAGAFYRATHLPAPYAGSYFFVDHVQGNIRRRDPSGQVTVFATGLRYPVDLKVGPDGNLYYTDLGVLGAEFSPEFTNPSPTGTVRRIRYTPPGGSPAVTVTAADASASETGPDPGTFTLTRSGATTSPLTVNFTVGGSATNGTDCNAIGTSATIPAGSATATITVTPIDDTAVESPETVILTLSPGAAYAVGTPSGSTVTIADNDSPPPPPDRPPVVSFTNPASGAALTGTVAVNARASDPDAGTADGAGIATVLFELIQGTTMVASQTESFVTYDWSLDTTLYADGAYTLRATATSTAGAGGTSTSVGLPVMIANAGPPADSDGDGLPDAWEIQYFGNLGQTGSVDPDADGLTNAQEYARGTDPTRADTDGDGMRDGWEVPTGFDPLNPDQDANGVLDGQDDWDGDGIVNQIDPSPGSPPAPAAGGGGGGGGGGCGATGVEALLFLGFSLLARRRD